MVVLMRLQEAKQMERLTLDDMIKALKCVASQDTVGDCYADHENFIHMDDEHKRIVCGTGEDLRDYVSGKEAIGCPYHQNIYGCCVEVGELYWLKDVAELLEELKSYKDLEEQGLLVRLPYNNGALYSVNYSNKTIAENTIIEIAINDHSKRFSCLDDNLRERKFYDYMIGENVFLTREEAEKKLV